MQKITGLQKEKSLVGLAPVVKITTILRAAFALISFCYKITNKNCKYKKV
jgi:hypothetical protein